MWKACLFPESPQCNGMKTLFFLVPALLFIACENHEPVASPDPFTELDLTHYTKQQLQQDFDLLVNSLKEAHTGLYWYATRQQFDSVVAVQRTQLKDGLNGLQFYTILAPVVAFTKEDHCDIHLSEEVQNYLSKKGHFLPLHVVNLDGKMWIVNDLVINGTHLKGRIITAIDGKQISAIRKSIYQTFASDGFILSSKIVFLDGKRFAMQYAKVMDQKRSHQLTVYNPENQLSDEFKMQSVSWKTLQQLSETAQKSGLLNPQDLPATFEMKNDSTAVLTFNTFSNSQFDEQGMHFRSFVDYCFRAIRRNHPAHLIIDLRENGGGSEGNEDYLFSYLTDQPYRKYTSVELSNRTFRFLPYTDYAAEEDKRELYAELEADYYQTEEGKLFRKAGLYVPEPLKSHPYTGKTYILTSGWTYSGAAEFCSLMREHTSAIFIGQETGGGFYGNTSGTSLELTLPNTGIIVDIPVLKFSLDVRKGLFGRGVLPDYPVEPTFSEYIRGIDAEMRKALKLTRNKW